jgi:hypothetical protein
MCEKYYLRCEDRLIGLSAYKVKSQPYFSLMHARRSFTEDKNLMMQVINAF